jgi:ubiquinone/menaquinone biosynthesis C-methylase UbiE
MNHLHALLSQSGNAQPADTRGRLIRWAQWYDPFVAVLSLGRAGAFRSATISLAQIGAGDRVLDVGCGTGDLTLRAACLAGPTGEVVGIDASPNMIEVARRKAASKGLSIRWEVEAIERLTFPDDTFDVALSSLMLHHLPGQLKHAGLAEVRRVLKPGGRLVAVDIREGASGLPHALVSVSGHGHGERKPGNLPELLVDAGFELQSRGTLAGGFLAYAIGRKGGESDG